MQPVSIKRAFLGFVVAQIAVIAVLGLLLHRAWQRDQERAFLTEAVAVRAAGATEAIDHALNEIWQSLQRLSESLSRTPDEELQTDLDMIRSLGGIAWVGMADIEGRVVASSDGILLGADVSARPWFGGGLRDSYAGDVHEAVLLNPLLGGTEDDPIRFLDFATPVREAASGNTVGVLALHIDTRWVDEYMARLAEAMKVDLFLVGPDGTVKLGTSELPVAALDLPSLNAARKGIRASGQDIWPDGRRYFTTAAPYEGGGDMPGFGWMVVARIDPAISGAATRPVTAEVRQLLALSLMALLVSSYIFWKLFLAPVRRLARAARLVSEGRLLPPPEERSTAEFADWSLALATLQAKDLAAETNLRRRPGTRDT